VVYGDFFKGDDCPDCIETKVYKSICKILDSYNISYNTTDLKLVIGLTFTYLLLELV
jgi:hypothetical protein